MGEELSGSSDVERFAVWFMDARQFTPIQAAAAKGVATADDIFRLQAPTLELELQDGDARVYRLPPSEPR